MESMAEQVAACALPRVVGGTINMQELRTGSFFPDEVVSRKLV